MKDAKGQFMSRGHPTSILTGRVYSALRLVCYTCSYIFLAPKGKAHSYTRAYGKKRMNSDYTKSLNRVSNN